MVIGRASYTCLYVIMRIIFVITYKQVFFYTELKHRQDGIKMKYYKRWCAIVIYKIFNNNAVVKRYQEGISVKNAILWDIKRFYEDEYKIGLKVLDMIEKRFSFRLPDDEAGFIAIHIVESVLSENTEDMHRITEIISEISNIVKYNFHISFNEDSVYYYRFITHLKFFAQRLLEGKTYLDNAQDDLLYTIKEKYVNSYECADKISKFIKTKYSYDLSNDEKLYLTIHIERIVYKSVL